MPQPRVPTQILEARGGFLKHPERKRARDGEPQPTGVLGDPPKDLSKTEKDIWYEHSSKIPEGVASNWDATAFEVLVCLVANFRERRKNRIPQVVGEVAQMNKLFTQFGMTPSDRSRVKVSQEKPKADDPWSRLTAQ